MILKYIKENSLKILFIIFILFYLLIYVANDEKRGTLTSVTDHNVYLSNNCENFENIFDKKIDVCRDNIKELEPKRTECCSSSPRFPRFLACKGPPMGQKEEILLTSEP